MEHAGFSEQEFAKPEAAQDVSISKEPKNALEQRSKLLPAI